MKRSLHFFLGFAVIFVSLGLSRGNELRVIADKADVYAEPDHNSYRIETIGKGTSLTLFQKGKVRKKWYYILFFSEQRKGRVSGFIQDSMVVAAKNFKGFTGGETSVRTEDRVQALPIRPVEIILELGQEENTPEITVDEELLTTPLRKDGLVPLKSVEGYEHLQIRASSTIKTRHFKEISKRLVEIEERSGLADLSFSKIEGNLFQETIEPPVEIKVKERFQIDPEPSKEVFPFRRKKETAPLRREEELSLTPLLTEGTNFHRRFKDEENLQNWSALLEQVTPTREAAAFITTIDSPVELKVKKIFNVSASPTKEILAFPEPKAKSEPIEELSTTPILERSNGVFLVPRQGSKRAKVDELTSSASSKMEKVPFQRIIEPPVELRVNPIPSMIAFPEKKVTAFERQKNTTEGIRVEERLTSTPLLENRGNSFWMVQAWLDEKGDQERLLVEALVDVEVFAYKKTLEPQIKKTLPEIKEESRSRIQPASAKTTEVVHRLKQKKPKMEKPLQKIEVNSLLVQKKQERKDFRWITLGLGYGQSLGGVGGFLQFNTKAGISIHGGVGYYPSTYIYSPHDWVKNVILFNSGIKYYLPLNADPIHVYLDVRYGGIGVEAAQIIKGIWNYTFVLDYKQKTLWGPSFLSGIEFRVGHVGLNGALGLSYNFTKLDWPIQNYFFTFDLGLLLLF